MSLNFAEERWREDSDLAAKVTRETSTICIQTIMTVDYRAQTELTHRTHLAAVTLHVEVSVQGHDPDGLLLARRRHDGLRAHTAARSKLPATHKQEEQD